METKKRTTKKDLAFIRRNISRLKKDLHQLRKLLKQPKPYDFPFIRTREVRKMLRAYSSSLIKNY